MRQWLTSPADHGIFDHTKFEIPCAKKIGQSENCDLPVFPPKENEKVKEDNKPSAHPSFNAAVSL